MRCNVIVLYGVQYQTVEEDSFTTMNGIHVLGHLSWVNSIYSLVISANLTDIVSSQPLLSPSVSPSLLLWTPCSHVDSCFKSFNPIRLCKYSFARCLPRTSQIENSCPEYVLLSSPKKQTATQKKAKSLKCTFTIYRCLM